MAGLLDLEEERRKNLAPTNPRSIAGLLGTVGENPNARMMSMAQEHFRTLPQKFDENQQYQMDLLARAYPGNTFKSMMLEGDPKAISELAMQAPIVGMMAYHGTPHNILGKFDINKVGTGEGAQAYGHGMYFAENPNVAKQYIVNAELQKTPEGMARSYAQQYPSEKEALEGAKQRLQRLIDGGDLAEAKTQEQVVKALESGKLGGNLYKVDIPDKDIPNMLDWDKPLNQQSDVVKKALGLPEDKFAGFKVPATGTNYSFSPNWRGEDFYKALTDLAKTQSGASEMLNSMGIKGIRYKDAMSRNADKGTSNFVVFEPSTVKILEKNKKKVGLLD